jgi:2-polyprenyl-6-methoxyphenol hydroxylase-like FAD-dependent oxidoreductase
MLDATELAMAIVEHVYGTGHGLGLEDALARYEAAMFPRAADAAAASAQGLVNCFAADSPAGLVKFFSDLAS